MLYVQPIYVRSTGSQSFPLLKRTFVQWGGNISFEPTLGEALDAVFGTATEEEPPATTPPGAEPPPGGTGDVSAAVRQTIADANRAYSDGQRALREGNFAAYGEAQRRLQAALQRLSTLTRAAPQGSGTASPSPVASPSG